MTAPAYTPIGELREVITVQQVTRTKATAGWATDAWTTLVADVRAKVEPLDGRELFEAQAVTATLSHRITIRYRSGLLPKMRVVWGDLTLEIASLVNVGARNRRLVLLCGATNAST